jgi:glutamine amidotransferase
MLHHGTPGKASTCVYGTEFMAAYEHENVYATQFHPEKSQTNGLILLKNFLKL